MKPLKKIPTDIWTQLINLLGEKIIKPKILSDGTTLSRQYTSVDYLKNMDPQTFINERENILVAFLKGISGRIFKDESSHVAYQIACVIESIYYLVNFNWIFPHCFVINLIQSTISGSKTVTTLNGKVFPGGGYTTYHSWLNNVGNKHLVCPPGNVETYIDNIGKYIIKNYRVSKDKNNTADVITTTLHIKLDKNIQTDQALNL